MGSNKDRSGSIGFIGSFTLRSENKVSNASESSSIDVKKISK